MTSPAGAEPPRWPLGLPSRLRPVRVLAVGATSVVWQARDTELGADRAVKVLRAPDRSGHDPARAGHDPARRVETEARAVARLAGLEGVVVLHEVGRTDTGVAWLAHDLVTGGTLAERAPCGADELTRIGAALASTLARAHRRQVHHGDVSPTNVVFDERGEPLLADFGVAGLGHAPDDPGGLTPAYAAPERLRGGPPSAASDVYSLVATLGTVSGPHRSAALDEVLRGGMAARAADRPDAAMLADGLRALRSR